MPQSLYGVAAGSGCLEREPTQPRASGGIAGCWEDFQAEGTDEKAASLQGFGCGQSSGMRRWFGEPWAVP